MKFEYYVELHEGYFPTMQMEPKNEMRIQIEAKNRVTADRMIKALLTRDNVREVDGVCID